MKNMFKDIKRQVLAKKNTTGAIIIFTLLLLVAFTSTIVFIPSTVQAEDTAWYDVSWNDRIPLNLSTSSTSTVVDYQVFLNVTFQTGMQNDFDDVRFVNYSDHTDVWDAWLEYKVDSSYALIWLEVNTSITTANQTLAYMYYNNSGASSDWDGTATFNWFSHFDTDITSDFDNSYEAVAFVHNTSIGFNATEGSFTRYKAKVTEWIRDVANAGQVQVGLTKLTGEYPLYVENFTMAGFYTKTDICPVGKIAWRSATYQDGANLGPVPYGLNDYEQSTPFIWQMNYNYSHTNTTIYNATTYEAGNYSSDNHTSDMMQPLEYFFFRGSVTVVLFGWDGDSSQIVHVEKNSDGDINMSFDWVAIGHWQSDEPTYYFGTSEQEGEDASSYSILGLEGTDKNVTWTGVAGTTVWSNVTNPGGTMELNMSINASSNVTIINISCTNLDASIPVNNITLYVSNSSGVTFYSFGVFTVDENITINQTTWDSNVGIDNPFDGVGLTNKTTSIFCRFTLAISSAVSSGDYSQNDWKVWFYS